MGAGCLSLTVSDNIFLGIVAVFPTISHPWYDLHTLSACRKVYSLCSAYCKYCVYPAKILLSMLSKMRVMVLISSLGGSCWARFPVPE